MFAVAQTDLNWFTYLKETCRTETVNFWTPTPWNVRKLSRGDKWQKNLSSKERKGQPSFRKRVLKAYGEKCCVTNVTTLEVIEAAHIQEYINDDSNHVQNGLPMRVDIHRLFDAGLLTINSSYRVEVSEFLNGTEYEKLHNHKINLPDNSWELPSIDALKLHNEIIYRGRR